MNISDLANYLSLIVALGLTGEANVMRKPKIIAIEDVKVERGCTLFVNSAEKELFAFALAVHSLFGAGQVRYSVEDWICELQSIEWPPQERVPDWRRVTIAAARRLAARKPWMRPRIGERSQQKGSCHVDSTGPQC